MELTTLFVFTLILTIGIASDLYAHRNSTEISFQDATVWSIIWVLLSVGFSGYLALFEGKSVAQDFITGYILEKVLSVDNLFVFMAIFSWFKLSTLMAHRVLYWGILGAIFFRLIFVLLGTTIMEFSHWVEVVFGLIVIYTGYKLLTVEQTDEEDFSKHLAYRLAKKFLPVTDKQYGNKFFVKLEIVPSEKFPNLNLLNNFKWYATPLFLCLIVIEMSDILFAFDSVPAILAITKETDIVWYAMILAMCGLRTMYFMLDALKRYFIYLEKAVILILFFIGGKLVINSIDNMYQIGYNIGNNESLTFIVLTLVTSIILSAIKGKNASN